MIKLHQAAPYKHQPAPFQKLEGELPKLRIDSAAPIRHTAQAEKTAANFRLQKLWGVCNTKSTSQTTMKSLFSAIFFLISTLYLVHGSVAAERVVKLDGFETAVTDNGSGEPVILIHALGLDHRMWDRTADLLKGSYRVITYDVRGHGRAAGASRPFSMALFAQDMLRLMDTLGLHHAHIVGLSMGGSIAQQFAIDYPERVHTLTVIASVSQPQASFLSRGESAFATGMEGQLIPSLTRWFTANALAENHLGVQYARDRLRRDSVDDWAASWKAMAEMNFSTKLHQIGAPTLVVAGELDVSATPAAMYRDIAAQIPNASFQIIPNASHMVSLVAPDELAHRISAWVDKHRAHPRAAAHVQGR